jgi:hypothetical protein
MRIYTQLTQVLKIPDLQTDESNNTQTGITNHIGFYKHENSIEIRC